MSESFNQDYVVSSIEEDPQVLRDRVQDYGYVFIKGYVPAARCQALMDELLQVLHPHLVYDASGRLPVARGEPCFETDPIRDDVYPRVQRLEQFHHFFHDEHLLSLRTQGGAHCRAGVSQAQRRHTAL